MSNSINVPTAAVETELAIAMRRVMQAEANVLLQWSVMQAIGGQGMKRYAYA
jgi:hypothetical protein